ncbi:Similar to SUGP1: SURP and G-patch domain-containing protein 1 (Homo sapiens), partial [Cotesia congregata]
MAYRGVKGSDPFVSKTSRNERFAQMSKQEQIIQQKKLEIQAKMEEMKAKAAVEVKKTSPSTSPPSAPVNKVTAAAKKEEEKPPAAATVNLFANDGSFLDQFKKISNKTSPRTEESPPPVAVKKEDRERNYERRWNGDKNREYDRRDRRRNESRWNQRSERGRRSSSSSPSPPRHRSPVLERYHQPNPRSPSSIPPLISPRIQQINVPPPNLRNVPPPSHIHNIPPVNLEPSLPISVPPPPSRISVPPPHMIRPPPPPQINTKVPPPSMQLNQPPPSQPQGPTNPLASIPSKSAGHISPQCSIPITNLQPQNQAPRPTLLPPMSRMPPNIIQMNPNPVPSVPPSQVIPPLIMSTPPPVHNSNINSVPPPNVNVPPPNVPPPSIITGNNHSTAVHLLPTTYPIQNQIQLPVNVQRPGVNVQIPPPVQPPLSSDHFVGCQEAEQLARIVADCGDAIEQEVREKNLQDPKLWFLHQKQSAAYLQYRGLVAKYRAEKADKGASGASGAGSGSGAEPYCPEDALSDNDDVDKVSTKHILQSDNNIKDESKEERRRKRRSRWSEPDNKVEIPTVNNQASNVNPLNQRPGIGLSGPLGQGSALLTPKTQNPKSKNPMLTKISRNDPALVVYARQTFGTYDLTEEQWKKAEDHYKINLLYQNLMKKREEVKRLESQGKHKYEYDSDEETEGGTWEHKLRSAEMEATQMWAEELTAQSEGKHHIGDFLPPDELKKFMEQYNAVKQGKEPDLSDYKEFKLKEDNIGFQMLQKLGWTEGQGLGSEGSGRIDPVNKATSRLDSSGLGSDRPDNISRDDDEFDAYRKRMMLAYRFRPNPL